jgi:glycosyltransferase involved in cell wall biosynthesis
MKSLGILVCTIDSRAAYLERLMRVLKPQLTDDVELIVDCDNGEISIGAKRNLLVQRGAAVARYLAFIDDDDLVSNDYCGQLLAALTFKPDCVGFNATRWVDGRLVAKPQVMSLRYPWYRETLVPGRTDLWRYERPINHLCPIRSELVRSVPFKEINAGEDCDFSNRIRPMLGPEVFVDHYLYHYLLRTERPGETTNAGTYATRLGSR